MIAWLGAGLAAGTLLIPLLAAAALTGLLSTGGGGMTASADLPAGYAALYTAAAATCPGLPAPVLAAVGKIESDHGRDSRTSDAGAEGPMQFLPATFAAYAVDADGGGARIDDPADAVYTAAAYLCASGAANGADIPGALYQYNHDTAYVARVLTIAASYSEPTPNSSVACPTLQSTVQYGTDDFSSAPLAAVAFACAQVGEPYVWGGNGDPGFDCSGLTHAAYAAVGVLIPRTAQTQYDAGPLLPAGAPLQPGDLVFFGTPQNIHHVGISLGGTVMVDAPDFGRSVMVRDFRGFSDYAGARRLSRVRIFGTGVCWP